MRFHSAAIVTAPNRNRLAVMPRSVSQKMRPMTRIARYVMKAGCVRLATHTMMDSASTAMVNRLQGATVISIS